MKLVVVGVNHKTAPIALREKLAFASDDMPTALAQLSGITAASVIVSTCNRTEIYALAKEPNHISPNNQTSNQANQVNRINDAWLTQTLNAIYQWLADYKGISLTSLSPYLYSHKNTQAMTHWIRVSAGLDSMILGEPQILGQIKQAVSQSLELGYVSSAFGWLADQVFWAAKNVRHNTQVGSQAVTLGFAAAKLAMQIFHDVSKCTLLVVAAGEMNRLVASHIAGLGVQRIIICNRSADNAKLLADELASIAPHCQIDAQPLTALANGLAQADIVSSCSGSMHTLIDLSMTQQALKIRRHRPILMVDLAVPRDIDERVSLLDDIYLYSVDDLQHVIAGNLEQRRQAAVDAEMLVSQLVLDIERRLSVRRVGSDIHTYRQMAEQHAQTLLKQALIQLKQSNTTAEDVLTDFSQRLTQTLTHAPSKLMRHMAEQGDDQLLNDVVRTLKTAYRPPSS